MDGSIVSNMRDRLARCRRLADSTTDPRTEKILRQMADEIEADLRRLEADQSSASEED